MRRNTNIHNSIQPHQRGGGGGGVLQQALLVLAIITTCCLPSSITTTDALLIRSEGSGGFATGLAYNADDNQVVIVGTTLNNNNNNKRQQFWGLKGTDNNKGGCFVALGDGVHTTTTTGENPKFSRLAVSGSSSSSSSGSTNNKASACFGGTTTLNHQQEGGLGVASILGVELGDSTDTTSSTTSTTGFMHSIVYYLGQVSVSASRPIELPANLLPVASYMGSTGETYMGLHELDPTSTPFGTATTSNNNDKPLLSLLRYWWGSTYPPNLYWVLGEGEKVSQKPLSRDAPHVRKQDVFTGLLSYDVSLETDLGRATLIGGIGKPATTNGDDDDSTGTVGAAEQKKKRPLIVAGSTNAPSTAISLFGQADGSKSANLTDWDGYILFLDAETGAVFEEDGLYQLRSIRINSVADEDDFIQGLCLSPDQRYLYVVGTTQGILSGIHAGGAFVYQIDLDSTIDADNREYTVQWRFQISGVNVQGLACTADADSVYLGGSTESSLWETKNSTTATVPTLSPDAFVTKIQLGKEVWTHPLDTTLQENEEHRREMIVGMEVTNLGYVLVLMNSMDLKTGMNDVYLLDVDPTTGENDLYEALNGGAGITIPTFGSENDDENDVNDEDKNIVAIAVSVPVVVAILLFGITYWRHRTHVERLPKATQKDHVEKDKKQEAVSAPEAGTGLV